MTSSAGIVPSAAPDALARFAITVAFTIRPDRRDHFLTVVCANAAASLSAEPGCLHFDVLTPLEGGGPDVLLYEVYVDRSAFDAHLATAHFLAFDAATREIVSAKTVSEFRVEAPKPA
jgi:(4S)-4-hydroxy-5-phosphonooxypentane-2,3-dione isomerase